MIPNTAPDGQTPKASDHTRGSMAEITLYFLRLGCHRAIKRPRICQRSLRRWSASSSFHCCNRIGSWSSSRCAAGDNELRNEGPPAILGRCREKGRPLTKETNNALCQRSNDRVCGSRHCPGRLCPGHRLEKSRLGNRAECCRYRRRSPLRLSTIRFTGEGRLCRHKTGFGA